MTAAISSMKSCINLCFAGISITWSSGSKPVKEEIRGQSRQTLLPTLLLRPQADRDTTLRFQRNNGVASRMQLCQKCAKLIDNDPVFYDVEFLKTWKKLTEHDVWLTVHIGDAPIKKQSGAK